ncbi:hypothetical protein QLX08_005897 [Tetragonisca angustula]|uniref:Uncharacterized protein n=1 Tax=Tetragonisca angustula TaxID=166442 RepID=A0AAW0ZW75_9HYME
MWSSLCEIFEKDSQQQKCNLLQEFYNYLFEKITDISTDISKLHNLRYNLEGLNTDIDDDMLMVKIIGTLPIEYKYFASAWKYMQKEEKTLENLTARFLAEETRMEEKWIT